MYEGEEDVGNPVPTSGDDSAAGMLVCEAGDATEAVIKGSGSAGRLLLLGVGPSSFHSNAVAGLSNKLVVLSEFAFSPHGLLG